MSGHSRQDGHGTQTTCELHLICFESAGNPLHIWIRFITNVTHLEFYMLRVKKLLFGGKFVYGTRVFLRHIVKTFDQQKGMLFNNT